jgi:hypothetical protein
MKSLEETPTAGWFSVGSKSTQSHFGSHLKSNLMLSFTIVTMKMTFIG